MALVAPITVKIETDSDLRCAGIARPGDTLILEASMSLTHEQVERIRVEVEKLVNTFGIKVIFLGGVHVGAIVRPEDGSD